MCLLHDSSERCVSMLSFRCIRLHYPAALLHIRRLSNQLIDTWFSFFVTFVCRKPFKCKNLILWMPCLTHWGRVTHICVSKLIIIGSDNGLSPGRRQAITWTNAGILLIGPLGTSFSEILVEIHISLFKETHLKMSSAKCRPSCLGLNVLNHVSSITTN